MNALPPARTVRALALLLAAVVYVIFPVDLLPDFMPLVGWLDDLLVFGLGAWFFLSEWKKRGERLRSRPAGSSDGAGPAAGTAEDAWSVLGLAPGARPEDIKRAYREQMAQYHPDKVAHLGPELRKVAHERAQKIQQAYRELAGEEAS